MILVSFSLQMFPGYCLTVHETYFSNVRTWPPTTWISRRPRTAHRETTRPPGGQWKQLYAQMWCYAEAVYDCRSHIASSRGHVGHHLSRSDKVSRFCTRSLNNLTPFLELYSFVNWGIILIRCQLKHHCQSQLIHHYVTFQPPLCKHCNQLSVNIVTNIMQTL